MEAKQARDFKHNDYNHLGKAEYKRQSMPPMNGVTAVSNNRGKGNMSAYF